MRITGTVTDVFQPTRGEAWGVATVEVEGQHAPEKVVGSVGMARVGEQLVATGDWSTSARYGRQFRAQSPILDNHRRCVIAHCVFLSKKSETPER